MLNRKLRLHSIRRELAQAGPEDGASLDIGLPPLRGIAEPIPYVEFARDATGHILKDVDLALEAIGEQILRDVHTFGNAT